MTYYHTTDSDGLSRLNPTRSEYIRMLRDFLHDDAAIGDIWLSQLHSGWSISVFPSGLVHLEHESGQHPTRELGPVSLNTVIELWDDLAAGRIENLMKKPWKPLPQEDSR